jgi:hypothetical protein
VSHDFRPEKAAQQYCRHPFRHMMMVGSQVSTLTNLRVEHGDVHADAQ